MPKYRVVGIPGAGKTTTLRRRVERWVADGYDRDSIIVCSLTRTAAAVIADRIDLPPGHAATLHSLAYRGLDAPTIAEVGPLAKEWNSQPNLPPEWRLGLPKDAIDEGVMVEQGTGAALSAYSRLRAQGRTDWDDDFVTAWEGFKGEHHAMDFQDLIDFAHVELPTAPGDPAVFVVDEAQDLTPSMWTLADQWGEAAAWYVVAGDPAQCLFQWSGADYGSLLEPLPDGHHHMLPQSWRLPRAVAEYAESWLQGHTPPMSEGRMYRPRDVEGEVNHADATWRDGGEVLAMVEGQLERGGTVMVLTSCAYMLEPTVAALRAAGLAYHNPYRRANGRWNPLREQEGKTSTLHRLSMFLSDVWSDDGAVAWLDMLPAKWFRGAKKAALESLAGQRRLTIRDLAPLLHDAVLNAHAGQDGDWLEDNVLPRFTAPLAYGYRLWQRDPASIAQEPRIVVGTVHSVKGGEADHVLLAPDLSPAGQAELWAPGGRDAAIRLHYVGLTRARETVTLLRPASMAGSVYA